LTTNVDLHATIAEVFGVPAGGPAPAGGAGPSHGRSLVPLLTGATPGVRDWAIGGVFGNWVQVTDGRRKYARGPVGDIFPLSMWSNRWSTMPVHGLEDLVRLPPPDRRARLGFMPGTDTPVIRQPFAPGDRLPFWVGHGAVDSHFLFDLSEDPGEDRNLSGGGGGGGGPVAEAEMVELLRVALQDVEAPEEQLERLGVA
jgi:hypothetical protein